MGKTDLIKGLQEMAACFGTTSTEHRDFLKEVIAHIEANEEKEEELFHLRKRVMERLYLEASNLLYDPNDFFDDLSKEETEYIKKTVSIEIKVREGENL